MKKAWRRSGTKIRCAQSWQIEAARDGRLSGESLEAVARHLEHCAECYELSSYFAGLGEEMRKLDELEIDDIALRRLREEILCRVDAEMTGRSVPPLAKRGRRFHLPTSRRLLLVPLVASIAAVVAIVTLKRPHVPSSSGPSQAPMTTVETIDEGGARWTQTTNGGVEWIDLSDGTLRLQVHKASGSRRVVVRVPDGEIEDIGTVFHVVVSHGRTQRVGVDEGRVTIRLRQMAPITISSGASWARPEEPVSTSALPSAWLTPSVAPPTATPPSNRLQVSSPPRHQDLPATQLNTEKEDAAYLRTITLLREGRNDEAKVAAKDYLKRFPDGFRREEMAKIAE
jgi:FecR protein